MRILRELLTIAGYAAAAWFILDVARALHG
jgi:hypothetical protein